MEISLLKCYINWEQTATDIKEEFDKEKMKEIEIEEVDEVLPTLSLLKEASNSFSHPDKLEDRKMSMI